MKKSWGQISLKKFFFCVTVCFIGFLVFASVVGSHFFLKILFSFHEKSQTEEALRDVEKNVERNILILTRQIGLYLNSSSKKNKANVEKFKKKLSQCVSSYIQRYGLKGQKKESMALFILSERLNEQVDQLLSFESIVRDKLLLWQKQKTRLWTFLTQEKRDIDLNNIFYKESLEQILRLETYIQMIDSLRFRELIEPDFDFYNAIYDIERDCQAIFESEDGIFSRLSSKRFFRICKQLALLIQTSYELTELRKKKEKSFHSVEQLSSLIIAFIDKRIVFILDQQKKQFEQKINRRLWSISLFFVFLIVAIFAFCLIFYVFFTNVVINPVVSLSRYLKQETNSPDAFKNNFIPSRLRKYFEIKNLYESFDVMINKIKKQESLLKNFIDNMEEFFILTHVKDDGNRFVVKDYNSFAEKCFGLKKNMILGKDLVQIFPWIIENNIDSKIVEVFSTGLPQDILNISYVQNGYQKIIDGTLYKVDEGIILLGRDITERKIMENKLLHSEKLVAVGQISAGVVHDIGNPLTAISSVIQILKKQENNPQKQKDLSVVYQNIQRIQDTLSIIMDYARKPEEKEKVFSLHNCLESVLYLIRYHEKLKNIEIHCVEKAKHILIFADQKLVEQVIFNIIINGADAIEAQKRRQEDLNGVIQIRTANEDGFCLIQFIDNGVGWEGLDLKKMFEPFFTTKERWKGSGSGLGLTIVKNTLERYNGSIEVFSAKPQGAKVVVKFPLYKN